MNAITSTAQHPDHCLSAVPSVDLTDGVDLTHQLALDSHQKFRFFSCHDLAVAALGGLIAARNFKQFMPAADDQQRSEEEEKRVNVTDRVEGRSNACANERNGDGGVAHSSRLGFKRGERLAQPLDLAGFGLSDAVQPELFDGGSSHLRSVSNDQNFPAREVLELQAQGLNNRSLLIHLRIVIHKRIVR